MKGSARIIGSISGRAKGDGVTVGEAVTASMLTKGDALVMGIIAAGAYDVGILTADAVVFGQPTGMRVIVTASGHRLRTSTGYILRCLPAA